MKCVICKDDYDDADLVHGACEDCIDSIESGDLEDQLESLLEGEDHENE